MRTTGQWRGGSDSKAAAGWRRGRDCAAGVVGAGWAVGPEKGTRVQCQCQWRRPIAPLALSD